MRRCDLRQDRLTIGFGGAAQKQHRYHKAEQYHAICIHNLGLFLALALVSPPLLRSQIVIA